ncbi:hypothetical protein [Tychonema sp. BBK16]|uniref:hypothetical protein n=1 Tax=Tychonema sp. BBK16 TaxID=2699888 RepID=UPI001F421A45|nr:hypothetical protein [Tychonema sp. BBK16]MCF6374735.1 hypothetical protein [Tychonema sp. BBK16]
MKLYQFRLHRNDINGEDGGDGSAVSLQFIASTLSFVMSPKITFISYNSKF